jgi:hypothetical protein
MGKYKTPAEMMDDLWFRPHNSEVTGEMIQQAWRETRVPPHILLSVMGAETSLGDPKLGGDLIRYGSHNYGCMKAGPKTTPWGALADGTVVVAGKTWFTFPDVETGVRALALLLAKGPSHKPGYYARCFRNNTGWMRDFALVYYGANVTGLGDYIRNLTTLDAKFRSTAARYGWRW